jgi:hypothetical protein
MTDKMPSVTCSSCPPGASESCAMPDSLFCEECQEEKANNIVERLLNEINMHDNSQQQTSEIVAILERALTLSRDNQAKAEAEAKAKAEPVDDQDMWECRYCTTLNSYDNTICDACAKTRDVHDQDDAEVALDDDVDSEFAAALQESKILYEKEEQRNPMQSDINIKLSQFTGAACNATSDVSKPPDTKQVRCQRDKCPHTFWRPACLDCKKGVCFCEGDNVCKECSNKLLNEWTITEKMSPETAFWQCIKNDSYLGMKCAEPAPLSSQHAYVKAIMESAGHVCPYASWPKAENSRRKYL